MGSWNILNLRTDISSHWALFAEGQIRSLRFYHHFHYYEYKGGGTYKLDKNFSFTAGVGRYKTFSAGGDFKQPLQSNEVRTWAQMNIKNKLGRLDFEHRYRAEQRFTANGYRNRFRYRLAVTVPLNAPRLAPHTLSLQGSNEIFLTNRQPFFERNRVAVNLGYTVNENLIIQSGFLHQYDYRLTDETGRTFFQIAGLFTLDLKKEKVKMRGDVED